MEDGYQPVHSSTLSRGDLAQGSAVILESSTGHGQGKLIPSNGRARRCAGVAAVLIGAVCLGAAGTVHFRQVPRNETETMFSKVQKDSTITMAESAAKIHHFYMYRVQNDEDYSPENQDMANIGGALWYLHNEIIWHHWSREGTYASTPKTRIERFLVFTKATPELFAKGMNFGVVNAYDLGKCTGPFACENLKQYGPVVGCESWTKPDSGKQGNSFPHQQWVGKNFYPSAVWYSLPGKCSSLNFWNQTGSCEKEEPSGKCPPGVVPSGDWTCTYTYQKVGELSINDIEALPSFSDFVSNGGREYDKLIDKGTNMTFWDGINDSHACQARIDTVNKLFEAKYPKQPVLEDPTCDFDVDKFYPYFPEGYFTTTTTTTTNKHSQRRHHHPKKHRLKSPLKHSKHQRHNQHHHASHHHQQ